MVMILTRGVAKLTAINDRLVLSCLVLYPVVPFNFLAIVWCLHGFCSSIRICVPKIIKICSVNLCNGFWFLLFPRLMQCPDRSEETPSAALKCLL